MMRDFFVRTYRHIYVRLSKCSELALKRRNREAGPSPPHDITTERTSAAPVPDVDLLSLRVPASSEEAATPGAQIGMDRLIVTRRWKAKRIAGLTVLGTLLVLASYYTLFVNHSRQLRVDSAHAAISVVHKGRFFESIPVTGTIVPMRTVYVDAIEGGRVETTYVEAGNIVNRGDRILNLSNTTLLSEVMYREAEFFQQANNLRNTRLEMDRRQLAVQTEILDLELKLKDQQRKSKSALELRKRGLISEQEFAQTQDEYVYLRRKHELFVAAGRQDSSFRAAQISELETSLERMEANLKLIRNRLETLTVRAPVTGLLTSLDSEVGQNKAPGDRLSRIDVLDGFKVRADVDEYYLPRVSIGQKAEFVLDRKTYRTLVAKIYPEVVAGRFQIDLEFSDTVPSGVSRGQTVHLRLELGEPVEAILLDRGAFYDATGGQWVYVVDKSGKFALRRSIKLGRRNPDVFEVLDGVGPGDRVITSSYVGFGSYEKLVFDQ